MYIRKSKSMYVYVGIHVCIQSCIQVLYVQVCVPYTVCMYKYVLNVPYYMYVCTKYIRMYCIRTYVCQYIRTYKYADTRYIASPAAVVSSVPCLSEQPACSPVASSFSPPSASACRASPHLHRNAAAWGHCTTVLYTRTCEYKQVRVCHNM